MTAIIPGTRLREVANSLSHPQVLFTDNALSVSALGSEQSGAKH